jgi:phenylpropionate dioxygenase-like ring-hydroxylating dioxygenase large terminal subunit
MFLYNNWYIVALAADLAPETLAACRVVDLAIVLFRTASGALGALNDACGCCGLRLSANADGAGDAVRCRRTGAEFSRIGACVQIPRDCSGDCAVRAYPVVEREGLVWLWPGGLAKADAAAIPAFPYRVDPDWAATSEQIEVDANWELFNDRLLDLNHLGYVHQNFAEGERDRRAIRETSVSRDGNTVRVRRSLVASEPPSFYRAAGGFAGKVDRWKDVDFRPGFLTFFAGAANAGRGAADGVRNEGVHMRHLHGITPMTETRTLYTYAQARNFQVGDASITAKLRELGMRTLRENQTALEAQQRRIADGREPQQLINVGADAGPAYARRIVRELYDAECAPSSRSALSRRKPFRIASSNSGTVSMTAPGGSSITTNG